MLPLLPVLMRLAGSAAVRAGSMAQSMGGSGMLRLMAGTSRLRNLSKTSEVDRPDSQSLLPRSLFQSLNTRSHTERPVGRPPVTPEMISLRNRINSPTATTEQRQSDRKQLADLLRGGRAEVLRKRESEKEKELRGSIKTTREHSRQAARFSLKMVGLTAAVGSATLGITRLGRASSQTTIDQLRIFSPRMAALAAQQEAFQIRQNTQFANMVGPSTQRAAEARMKAEEQSLPYRALGKNARNWVETKYNEGWSMVFDKLEEWGIKGAVNDLNSLANDANKKAGPTLIDVLKEMKSGMHIAPEARNRRPNERPGGRI